MSEPTAGEVLGMLLEWREAQHAFLAEDDDNEDSLFVRLTVAERRLDKLNRAHLRTLANALTPPAPASASAPELQEMFSVVRSAGPAEWNVTAPMTADEHGAEFARMVRDTQALHGLDDSPRAVHWLSVKDGLSLAFVGCSPHSPHLARGLAGAWNRLVAECPAESETP